MEERIIQLEERIRYLDAILKVLIFSDRYIFSKDLELQDGRNIQFATGTGTKIATGTGQKLSFFNQTPIVQQTSSSQTAATFVANTSGIANDTATWGGYTVGDIIAILQAFGLIA